MSEPSYYRVAFGPNALTFTDRADAIAYSREQGCERATYYPMWVSLAAL